MKRKNTSRNALFTSILSLLLCVSMLVGTTFAWFTDEVKSGINEINAGNLDIGLTYVDGNTAKPVTEQTVLFDGILWEPGAVAYEALTISNEGSLALKYAMTFTSYAENNLNGNKLSDILKVAIVEKADLPADMTNRDAVLAAAKASDNGNLWAFSTTGELYPKDNQDGMDSQREICVVIYWEPSDLDNLYNVNNGQQTSDGEPLYINFKLTLTATQLMYENDSFGPDYDEDAVYPENMWVGGVSYDWYTEAEGNVYEIATPDDLAGLVNIVNGTVPVSYASTAATITTDNFKGKTVKLTANMDLGNLAWTPMVGFAGTFDGQGYAIANLNITGASKVAFFAGVSSSAVITDVVFDSAYVAGNHYVAVVVGWEGNENANATIENVTVKNSTIVCEPELVAGKWDNGDKAGAIAGYAVSLNITGCTVENTTIKAYRDFGGIIGYAHKYMKVTGNTVSGLNLEIDNKHNYKNYASDAEHDGNLIVGEANAYAVIDGNKHLIGGVEYDAWNGRVPTAMPDSVELIPDADANNQGGTIVIKDAKAFVYLTKLVDDFKAKAEDIAGYDHYYYHWAWEVELAANIDLSNYPVDTLALSYFGNFDGKGYTVSNVVVKDGGVALFDQGTVENLSINNIVVNAPNQNKVGAVIGGRGSLKNVHVANATIVGSKYVGGLAGKGSSFIDCSIKNATVTGSDKTVGGLVGYSIGDPDPATVSGNSVENVTVTGAYNVGGLLGQAQNETVTNNSLKNITLISTLDKLPENASSNEVLTGFVVARNVGATIESNQMNGAEVAADAGDLVEALENGKDVVLIDDVNVSASEAGTNGYGATGVSVSGSTLDGNGNSLGVNKWGTWDSAINITSGTIKNVTVNSGMRGIFINHNGAAGKVYLENVIIDGTVYTISCDQGTNSGLEATNCTFNGWTSYAATLGDVKFVDCSFGEGQGYAYCRPYAPTEFVGCDFEAGFTVNPCAAVTFENCTIGGVALTAENVSELVTGTENVTVK